MSSDEAKTQRGMILMSIFSEIIAELKKAEAKWPVWHPDPIRGAATVAEEAGEVLQAALNYVQAYEADCSVATADMLAGKIDHELRHTGAMVFRMMLNRRGGTQ